MFLRMKLTRPTPLQALLLSLPMIVGIFWMDTRLGEVGTLYVVPIIFARWYGRPWSAWFIVPLCAAAELYSTLITGFYKNTVTHGHPLEIWFLVGSHLIAGFAITTSIHYIKYLIIRERKAKEDAREAHQVAGEALKALVEHREQVKLLESLLPICSYCKKIRDKGTNTWEQLESYIHDHADVNFTHGVCPECKDKVMTDFREELKGIDK